MRIEFKNGSVIESIDSECESIKGIGSKRFTYIDYMGDLYHELHWYQKAILKLYDIKNKIINNLIDKLVCIYHKFSK